MTEESDRPGRISEEHAETPDSSATAADLHEKSAQKAGVTGGETDAQVTPETDADSGDEPDAEPRQSRASLAMQELTNVRRPIEMSVGALFLTLASLPLILIGTALALQVGAIGQNLRERLAGGGAGLDVGSLILLFRFGGVALFIIGVLFLVFSWTALRPKRWARTAASVLAVVEILLLVGAMLVTTIDPVSLGIVLLAGAGVVLFYLPRSEEFLLTSR